MTRTRDMPRLCRSCNRPVTWAITRTGKLMPIDPVPRPDGTIRLVQAGDEIAAQVLTVEQRAGNTGPLYVSHFATCPQAWAHRRPRPARNGGRRG